MTKRSPAARGTRLLEVLGWLGTLAILAAYFATSYELLQPTSLTYALLNLFGGLTVGVISWMRRAWQPLTLNLAWALIAALTLL